MRPRNRPHILAVGRMTSAGWEMCTVQILTTDSLILASIAYGRRLYEGGQARSLCINQDEEAGWDEGEADAIAALAPLQDLIDRNQEFIAL